MQVIEELLARGETVILDGGNATELERAQAGELRNAAAAVRAGGLTHWLDVEGEERLESLRLLARVLEQDPPDLLLLLVYLLEVKTA